MTSGQAVAFSLTHSLLIFLGNYLSKNNYKNRQTGWVLHKCRKELVNGSVSSKKEDKETVDFNPEGAFHPLLGNLGGEQARGKAGAGWSADHPEF